MSTTRYTQPVGATPTPRRSGYYLPPIATTHFENLTSGAAPSQHQHQQTRRVASCSPTVTRSGTVSEPANARPHKKGNSSVTAPQPPTKPSSPTASYVLQTKRSHPQEPPTRPLLPRDLCTVLPVQGSERRPVPSRQSSMNAAPATHYYGAVDSEAVRPAHHHHHHPTNKNTKEQPASASTDALSLSSVVTTPLHSLTSYSAGSLLCGATPPHQPLQRTRSGHVNIIAPPPPPPPPPAAAARVDASRKASSPANRMNVVFDAATVEQPFTVTGARGSLAESEKSENANTSTRSSRSRRQSSTKVEDASVQQLLRAFLAERRASQKTQRSSKDTNATSSVSSTRSSTAGKALTSPPEEDAYMGLSPDEVQELYIVLQDLSHYLPAQQQQQQHRTPRDRRRSTASTTRSVTSTVAHSPKYSVHFSNADGEPETDSREQSVEGRYREALKTIEDAAGDCQVALKRVEDYSESLYTLVETWMHLHDNRFDEFAKAVLQRLLDRNPSYHVLFYATDVPSQALIIMDMIGRAVVAFTRPADLMDIMGEMGARHNLYGLTEAHFMSMRDCFLEVYAEFVGPETYAASVGVWRMFWKTTIELAVSGGSSERGIIYTQRRNVVWAERVQSAFKVLLPRQRHGGFHRLLQATYKRAIAAHPELYVLQQMSDVRTAHRCMESLIRITKSVTTDGVPMTIDYNDQFSVQALFTECGADFDAETMAKLEGPFLDACESYLEPMKAWNIVVRGALQELWSTYITGYWAARPSNGKGTASGATAPDGKEPFCLMFTDIEASTRLWDQDTKTMGTAITNHHQLIRGLIEDFGGYEVKTVGDSFLIATRTVTQALLIAFGIQLELMAGPSAPSFHMVDNPQGLGAAACWRDDALRVRVGINYCTDATAVYDSVHNRFDYYGPSVNCAARVEAAACGGQVLLSHDAYEHLQEEDAYARNPLSSLFAEQLGKLVQAQEARGIHVDDAQLAFFSAAVRKEQLGMESLHEDQKGSVGAAATIASLTHVEDTGVHILKGISEPVQLYSLLPAGLERRVFQKEENVLRTVASRGNLFGSEQFQELDALPSATESGLLTSLLESAPNSSMSVTPVQAYINM